MEELSSEHVRELMLNNTQTEVVIASTDCNSRTLDFLFEVKHTRLSIKKVKQLAKDLKDSQEVPHSFVTVVEAMIEDYNQLVKYHRKRTLTSMLYYDLASINKAR